MKKLIILFMTLSFFPQMIYCQLIRATEEMGNYKNPDVYIDTSGISDNLFDLSKTNKRLYSKNGFIFFIEVEAIKIPKAPPDSIIDLTWNSIDTSYKSLRQGFSELEKIFSTYKLRKIYPEVTKGEQGQRFEIRFINLVNVDSVISYLDKLNYIKKGFIYWLDFHTYVPNDRSLKPRTPLSEIQVTNPSSFYPPNWHKLGFGWNIYAMKGPMAWEITQGKEDIVIAVYDRFYDQLVHPDLELRTSSNDPGNWIQVVPATRGDGISCTTMPPSTDHGITTLPMAIAKIDNDNMSSPPSGGMVGISPKCRGIAFYGSPSSHDEYAKVDCDLEANDDTLKIAVISYSWLWTVDYDWMQTLMEAGIVLCGSAGNQLGDVCNCDGTFADGGEGTSTTSGYYRYWYPIKRGRGANVYIPDENDPTKDYKGLSVSATRDGNLYDYKCDTWGCNSSYFPNWKDNEHFVNDWCYSPGTEKFNTSASSVTRRQKKEDAYVDIAAPGGSNLTPDFNDDEKKYDPNVWGTSQSSPEIAGICGLMLSINKYMGVELDATYNRPVDGPDVQRKVYDAITFTADKLIDNGKSGDPYECRDKFQFLPNPIQPDYVTQANDNLKRTWAQRMGFGRVNAYRAVAHSIMQKGPYKYELSGNYAIPFAANDGGNPPDSRGYVNPDGNKIMHWGSQVKEGTGDFEIPIWRGPTSGNDGILNVLEYGGLSLPDEYHNNQGVTLIANTFSEARLSVTVPDECILAVDGYLVSDQPNSAHFIYANGNDTYTGKILMEGYLQDIEITGNLRIGDVTVNSSIVSDNYGSPGCIGFGNSILFTSEIYGKVEVINEGIIYSWGKLRMKPGSVVDMQGNWDFILNDGSETHMEYGSSVIGDEGRKIRVKDGATLYIDPGARVDILCQLYVEQGGKVIIQDSAIVNLKSLIVEPDGELECKPGSHLALIDLEHICSGILTIEGEPGNRVKITGRIGEHCLPDYDTLYFDYDNILTQPTIYVTGDCKYPDDSYLVLKYTDVKDVSIYVYNVRTDTIKYCSFTSESKQTNPHMQFDYLLSLNCDKCNNDCTHPLITRKRVEDCSFIDYSGPNINRAEISDPNKYTYNTGGLMAEGLEYLTNISNTFWGLEYGTWTINCDTVETNYCSFENSGIGDYDKSSYTLLCGNQYEFVEFGSIRDHSLGGRVFDNSYNFTRIAFNLISGEWQGFRNNTFNEFYYGIQSTCNEFYLGQKVIGQSAYIYGGNIFSITNPIPHLGNPDSYPNRFVYVVCDTNTADIHLIGGCCNLNMRCGYNDMATYTKHHLRHDQPGSTPVVDVSMNKFDDPSGFLVRSFDVNYSGIPINQSNTYPSMCDDTIGQVGCNFIAKSDKDKPYSRYEPINLTGLDYDNALKLFKDDNQTDYLRIKYSYYLYSLIKNEYNFNKFNELSETFQEIGLSNRNSFELRLTSIWLSGLLYESSGMFEEAYNSFTSLESIYEYDLSVSALKWSGLFNYLKNDALENKNKHSVIYAEYFNLVINDIRSSVEATCDRNDLVGIFDENYTQTYLEQNRPNPFISETEINYFLANSSNVKITITDLLGNKICVLVDEWQTSGQHSIMFNNNKYQSGVYLYRLDTNKDHLIKIMCIVK